jgi:alkylhydroperoxidase family enzyme
MPLIPYADTDALPEAAREAFDRLPTKLNVFRMWANAPECFLQGLRLGGAILGHQKLEANLRELLILLTAKVERGTYEWEQHVPIALALGCPQEQVEALGKLQLDDSSFDAREQVMLAFAADVIRNVAAGEQNLEATKRFFSAQEIVEIILTCGFYMMLARLTETTGVEIDAPGGMSVLRSLQRMA